MKTMYIKIKPVTDSNREEILQLRVASGQQNFIETTQECLKEASQLALWRPVGIYDDTLLIGFAMYGLFLREGENGRVWLDRLLIDRKYQGQGYGEAALLCLIDRIKQEYGYDKLFLSLYQDNQRALALYVKHGFQFNGETDIHGEKVMVKQID